MRRALNENPTVQIAILGACAVVLAILLYTTVLSSGSGSSPAAGSEDSDPAAAASDPAGAPEPPAAPAPEAPAAPVAPEAPAPGSASPAPGTSNGGSGAGLVPTRGLPEKVLVPLARGDAVALLVTDPQGISDRTVRAYVQRLGGRDGVTAIQVDVAEIARYSRITQGVNVSRSPALVVISPREGSDELTASVSYGFRGAKSVEVALEDALYQGGTRSAAP